MVGHQAPLSHQAFAIMFPVTTPSQRPKSAATPTCRCRGRTARRTSSPCHPPFPPLSRISPCVTGKTRPGALPALGNSPPSRCRARPAGPRPWRPGSPPHRPLDPWTIERLSASRSNVDSPFAAQPAGSSRPFPLSGPALPDSPNNPAFPRSGRAAKPPARGLPVSRTISNIAFLELPAGTVL